MARYTEYLPKAGKVVGRPNTPQITQKQSIPAPVPVPVNGLNTRDGFEYMDASYAVDMLNFIPTDGKMQVRRGSATYVNTKTGKPIGTLFSHGDKLYAISDGKIIDITDPEDISTFVTSTDAATVSEDEAWQTATLNDFTILCSNESNDPITIDPSGAAVAHGWEADKEEGTDNPVAALNVKDLFNPLVHKNRIFFLERGSNKVWYGDVLAIRGPLNFFSVNVNNAEGTPIAMQVLSLDGSTGLNDRLAIFMDSGQMVLYRGVDPAGDVEDGWNQDGTFQFGNVLSDRAVLKYGPDIAVLTESGVISVLNFQSSGGLNLEQQRSVLIPDTIQTVISRAAADNLQFPWWNGVYLRSIDPPLLLFNMPFGEQIALNVQTSAWTRFIGMDSTCWLEHNGIVYYGTRRGEVRRAFVPFGDETVRARFQTAFTAFEALQQNRFNYAPKLFRSLRVTVESSQAIEFKAGFALDYYQVPSLNSIATSSGRGGGFFLGKSFLGVDSLAPARVRETVHITGLGNDVSDVHGLPTKAAVVVEVTTQNIEFEVAGMVAYYEPASH